MADDFWGCPYTGGKEPCNPACVLFVRSHTTVQGQEHTDYCRSFGLVSKMDTGERLVTEEMRK